MGKTHERSRHFKHGKRLGNPFHQNTISKEASKVLQTKQCRGNNHYNRGHDDAGKGDNPTCKPSKGAHFKQHFHKRKEGTGHISTHNKSKRNQSFHTIQTFQNLQFLGVLIDSQSMTLTIPQEKMEKLKNLCLEIVNSPKISIKHLAPVIGKLRATAPAFTSAPLQVRYLQRLMILTLNTSNSYEALVEVRGEAQQELQRQW